MADEGITIGQAYLQIKPSLRGMEGELEQALGEEGERSSSSFGASFASGLKKVGAVAGAVVGAAATGVSALTKSAVNSYKEYEQLVGGVETLFGDSADIVGQNAAAAFQTAGMSANEYMKTVTSFSASLLQSLGGDTEKAAGVADMAIRDMSDNANKMGTSMESIQNAYQGFAKQNYTMLDNLKLGYGGTKSEMERLLADATELSGIEYNIESLSDVYDAIHVIQENIGITGTTALEAGATIEGSMGSVTAAWQNLVTGFANGDADLSVLIDQLVSSATTAMTNMIPAISQALVGIGDFVAQIAPIIAEKLPELIDAILPSLIEAAMALVQALVYSLPEILSVLIEYLPNVMTMIIDTILDLLPLIVQLGLDLILALANGLIENLPTLIPAVIDMILIIVEKLTDPDNLMMLIDASIQIIIAIAEGLINALPILLAKAPIIIANLVLAIIEAVPKLLGAAREIMAAIVDGIVGLLGKVAETGAQIVTTIKDGFMEKVNAAKEWGKDLIDNFIGGIKQKWEDLKSAVSNIANTVKDFLGFSEPDEGPLANFHTFAPDMIDLFAQGITKNVGTIRDAMGTLASAVTGEMPTSDVVVNSTMNRTIATNETASSGQMAMAGAMGGTITIPVYIGQKKIETLVVDALQASNYRAGGR